MRIGRTESALRLNSRLASSDGYLGSVLRCKYSDDDGHTWRPSEVLLFRDGGNPVLNPVAPTLVFGLEDGRHLLFM